MSHEEPCDLREALAGGWRALSRLLRQQGRGGLAVAAEELSRILAEATEGQALAEKDPLSGVEPERLLREPPAPPLVRTAAGRRRPGTGRKLA